jgi:hypothetical protein
MADVLVKPVRELLSLEVRTSLRFKITESDITWLFSFFLLEILF